MIRSLAKRLAEDQAAIQGRLSAQLEDRRESTDRRKRFQERRRARIRGRR